MRSKIVLISIITVGFMSSVESSADSSFKRSRWASQLQGGVLKVQGPGYGSWGKSWVVVASGVKKGYREVGTSKGPVLVYSKGPRSWHVVQLRFNTGARMNPRNFSQPVAIIRGGRYGVLIRVGKSCYDYSWKQLRPLNCNTRRFK